MQNAKAVILFGFLLALGSCDFNPTLLPMRCGIYGWLTRSSRVRGYSEPPSRVRFGDMDPLPSKQGTGIWKMRIPLLSHIVIRC